MDARGATRSPWSDAASQRRVAHLVRQLQPVTPHERRLLIGGRISGLTIDLALMVDEATGLDIRGMISGSVLWGNALVTGR